MQQIKLNDKKKRKLTKLLARYDKEGKTYSNFSQNKKDAYLFTSTIGVRACPYCNINFTYTVYSRPKSHGPIGYILRPDIDHFESQKERKDLTLSKHNLIPSCQQCNSRIKLSKAFSPNTHLHPYIDNFDEIKKFSIDIKNPDYLSTCNFEIFFKDQDGTGSGQKFKADRTIKDFALVERYAYHKEDVLDILKKAKFYHQQKIQEIEDLVKISSLSSALFTHRENEINEAPLTKLKNDIFDLVIKG